MANVYLRNGKDWRAGCAPGSDLIAACLEQEAIDLAIARQADGGIRVHGRHGIAEIQDKGATIHYQVTGQDPFGYPSMPSELNSDQSLSLTFDALYPDAPYQLVHLFRSSRAGDLVLSARKGYDLRYLHENPEHHASHGSLHREHMRVPLLINYPISRPFVRTVDVFPSMLELLGHQVPDAIDGRSFVSTGRMREASQGFASRNDDSPAVSAAGGIS